MSDRIRRVDRGFAQDRPSYRINRLGLVRGWDTTELCTSDTASVGQHLRGHDPNMRVWISATGTIWIDTSSKRNRGGRTRKTKGQAMRNQSITLIANTEYALIGSDAATAQMGQRLESFRNPETGELDIDKYCVKTKEPLW